MQYDLGDEHLVARLEEHARLVGQTKEAVLVRALKALLDTDEPGDALWSGLWDWLSDDELAFHNPGPAKIIPIDKFS